MQDISNLITIMFRKCYVFIPLNIEWISITYLAPENTIHKYISNVFIFLFFMYLTDKKYFCWPRKKDEVQSKSTKKLWWLCLGVYRRIIWSNNRLVNTFQNVWELWSSKMPQYLSKRGKNDIPNYLYIHLLISFRHVWSTPSFHRKLEHMHICKVVFQKLLHATTLYYA